MNHQRQVAHHTRRNVDKTPKIYSVFKNTCYQSRQEESL